MPTSVSGLGMRRGGLIIKVMSMKCMPTSVSGLGMRTGGLIFKVMSMKSHSPIMYCTGFLQTMKTQF